MSRQSLRDRQVQEYLDRDKNISSIISDSVQRAVRRYEPVLDPVRRELLNMLDIQNVGEYANQSKIRSIEKVNMLDNVLNTATPDLGKGEFASGVDKLTNYIADMIDYNRIIQVYLKMSNTPQTRLKYSIQSNH